MLKYFEDLRSKMVIKEDSKEPGIFLAKETKTETKVKILRN